MKYEEVLINFRINFIEKKNEYIVVGVLQVVNHGIPNSLIDGVKRVGKEFFQLPLEEKQKYAVKEGDLQGYGQMFVVSE